MRHARRSAPDAPQAAIASITALLGLSLALAACGGDDTEVTPPLGADAAVDASPLPDATEPPGADAAADAAPGTSDAPPGALVTLAPARGFLGAELDVAVTADFEATPPSVDFGAGVTVLSISVADGRVATVHLRIAPGAPIGAHDVHVARAGNPEITLPAAFTVEPGLAATTRGPRTQGSLLAVELESLDPVHDLGIAPFGISADLPRAPDFPLRFGSTVVLIPPGLAPGPYQLAWFAPFADGVPYSAADALVVEPFVPPLLAPGEITLARFAEDESHVFRVHAPEASIVSVQASGDSEPAMWIFDGAGQSGDELRVATSYIGLDAPRVWDEIPTEGEDFFVVVHGSRYEATHDDTTLRLDVRPASVTAQDDDAPHTTAATAQATTGCVEGCVLRGVLAPGAEHVFAMPARGALGAWITGLRADSFDVLVRSGAGDSGDYFLRSTQRLARPTATYDAEYDSSYYVAVSNSGTTAHPYAVSLRWKPLALGEDPQP